MALPSFLPRYLIRRFASPSRATALVHTHIVLGVHHLSVLAQEEVGPTCPI